MMEQAGIGCVEINEQMARTIPSPLFQAELWVLNEADYPAATALRARSRPCDMPRVPQHQGQSETWCDSNKPVISFGSVLI